MMKKRRAELSFYKRLLLSLFLATFMGLTVGVLIIYSSASQSATALNNELMVNNLSSTVSSIDQAVSSIDDTIVPMFLQKDVLNIMVGEEPFYGQLSSYNATRAAMNSAMAGNEYIYGLAVYKVNGDSLATTTRNALPYSDMDGCLSHFGMTADTLSDSGKMWKFMESGPWNDSTCFVNLRMLNDISNNQSSTACMCIFVSESKINKLYSFLGENSFLMTEDGTIVSCEDKQLIGSAADPELVKQVLADSRSAAALEYKIDDKGIYAAWVPSLACYLITASGTAISATITHAVQLVAIILLILGSAFSLIFAYFIAIGLTVPIKKLKYAMEKAQSGDLSVRAQVLRNDEIGYLASTFNEMMEHLTNYLEELDYKEKQKRESELKLLQAQINPHLLYNTLDSALYLMTQNDNQQAIQLLEELSRFFKLSLCKGSQITTVRQELLHVESYIHLQKLCRQKEIELKISGDLALLSSSLLHMTMEPIVENAVLHAFDGPYGGCITIELKSDGKELVITVADDGVGIENEELEKLISFIRSPESPTGGFGLWNVNQRIKVHYGDAYGITVVSEFGEGTSVTIRVPRRENEKESDKHV